MCDRAKQIGEVGAVSRAELDHQPGIDEGELQLLGAAGLGITEIDKDIARVQIGMDEVVA